MSRELSSVINRMYSTDSFNNCYYSGGVSTNTVKYMDISIREDAFEMPLFAFKTFVDMVGNGMDLESDTIAVILDSIGRTSTYVTVERYMKDVLQENYSSSRLVYLKVKQGDDTISYYGTQGAVFDKDFNPIMMCSYQMRRVHIEDAVCKYEFIKPILRISPDVYLNKDNQMEKFIANKMVNECLRHNVDTPDQWRLNNRFISYHPTFPVKVEIDASPFTARTVDVPGISTTNKSLLQLAIDHIDEIIQ